MSQPDGGSAFPYIPRASSGNLDIRKQTPGMSLRDWMAGMALQGFVTIPEKLMGVMHTNHNTNLAEAAAELAYAFADAMLAQREIQP